MNRTQNVVSLENLPFLFIISFFQYFVLCFLPQLLTRINLIVIVTIQDPHCYYDKGTDFFYLKTLDCIFSVPAFLNQIKIKEEPLRAKFETGHWDDSNCIKLFNKLSSTCPKFFLPHQKSVVVEKFYIIYICSSILRELGLWDCELGENNF